MVKKDEPDETAVSAAIAEAKNTEQIKVSFQGHEYLIERVAWESAQYVLLVQQRSDMVAAQYLLGGEQFGRLLSDFADEQGRTPRGIVIDFLNAVGQELGAGNR